MRSLRRSLIAVALLSVFTTFIPAQEDPVPEPQKSDRMQTRPEGIDSIMGGIVVNSGVDAPDVTPGNGVCETATGNGLCSLRAAVDEANAGAAFDVITFSPTITSVPLSGQITISSNLAIIGPGAGSLSIQNVSPMSATSRIFNVLNFTVAISGMTLTGGAVAGNGGAIQNIGTLGIINCVITGNSANGTTGVGGGIRSTNSLSVYNSVISNNSSAQSTSGGISFAGANITVGYTTINANTSFGNGGGMNISATASATISYSTISNNTAGASSGGLFLNRGTITGSTISGNTANGALATDGGGGIRIQAGANTVAINSCTITANTAPNAAAGVRSGIWIENGTLTPQNTIVAANVVQDFQRDGTAVINSGNFNLIGENTSVEATFPAGSPSGTNYAGTNAAPLNPMLGPLADNGGPTRTHALTAGSLAIDSGHSLASAIDQRRFFRLVDLPGTPNAPTGDGGDIGAYEFQSTPGVTVTVSGEVNDGSGTSPRTAVVLTGAGGITRTAVTNPFGYFRFDGVPFGESFVLTIERKGFRPVVGFITPEGNIVIVVNLVAQ